MKTVTTKVRLRAADYEVLKRESHQLSLSVEELLAHLAEEYVMQKSISNKQESKVDFMSLVNLGRSGESDISVNHDKHLGEAIAHEHNIR